VVRVPVTLGGSTREIGVKLGSVGGKVTSVKPEFEEARAWAEEAEVPVREVLRRAEEAAWRLVLGEGGHGG
jgi:uncharacterized protein (DUF111 family)